MPFPHETGYLLLGQTELAEQTMRALELKGDLPQLVDPRFQLGITVVDWTAPEYLWLKRTLSTTYRLAIAAGVGFPSVAQLTLSGLRPYVAAIDMIVLSNTTVAAIQYNVYLAAASTVAFNLGGSARDDRMRPNLAAALGAGGLLAGVSNTAAAPTAPAAGPLVLTSPANSTTVFEIPFVITGLSFFTVATVLNNTALEVSVVCRERPGVTTEA